MGYACDLRILLCYTFFRVYDHYHHIGPFNGRYGPDDAVTFQFLFDLAFPSEACRINKYVFCSFMNNLRIHCISGSACNIGNNDPVFSKKLIYNRRFTHIGLTYNCNSRPVILFLLCFREIKMFCHLIKKISKAKPGSCRYRDWITDTQIIKLIYIISKLLETVYLIDRKDNGFF